MEQLAVDSTRIKALLVNDVVSITSKYKNCHKFLIYLNESFITSMMIIYWCKNDALH